LGKFLGVVQTILQYLFLAVIKANIKPP